MRIDCSTAGSTAAIHQISTDSLGDHSYIVVVDGSAVAIDIQRDLDRFTGLLDGLDAGQSVGPLFDGLLRAWALVGAGRMGDALAEFDAIARRFLAEHSA